MSPTPVATHVLEALDVLSHNLSRVVLDRHGRQFGCEGGDGLGRQGSDFGEGMDGVLGEDSDGGAGP